eukprot:NODE_523_length_7257_cov_0.781922.p3 type:complete len:169 gc:universal NODE_523_length_7257_cov_0.781922:1634-1128(-)
MMSQLLLTALFGFDLAIAQNFGKSLDAGDNVKFDLYDPNGGSVPDTTEEYDVKLLDGTKSMSNAETVATLQKGLTKTKGIDVKLPEWLPTGSKYFFGIKAKSGDKYSGAFAVKGSNKGTPTGKHGKGHKPSEALEPFPTATITEAASAESSANSLLSAVLILIGINAL